MKKSKNVKIVVFVPLAHAEAVRETMGKAGAGVQGKYSFCSFSVKGVGRFKPEKCAHPAIGRVGHVAQVQEERIETICPRTKIKSVVAAIKKVHPYEEVAFDVYPLAEINSSNK